MSGLALIGSALFFLFFPAALNNITYDSHLSLFSNQSKYTLNTVLTLSLPISTRASIININIGNKVYINKDIKSLLLIILKYVLVSG